MTVGLGFKKRNLINFVEWIAAWEVIVLSGNSGLRIFTKGGLLAGGPRGAIVLVTFLSLWGLKSDKKFHMPSLGLAFIISAWLLLSDFIGNGISTRAVGATVVPLSTYILTSVSDFTVLREKLRRILTWICAGTLITYVIFMTTGIGLTSANGIAAQLFVVFRIWELERPCAIYQEPGQFQIIIFFILLLFTDELVRINLSRMHYYVRKFGIIIAALLVAQSSMGYICLMVYVMLLFTFNKSMKRNFFVYALIFSAGIAAAFFLWQSDTIQHKIDPRNFLNRRSSLAERVNDAITLYRMSFISPLTGLGGRSPDYYRYGAMYGGFPHADGVNGWLNVAVCYGWPFFFLIVISMILGMKRMKPGVPPILLFTVLLLSQADETNAIHYALFLYVFPFNSYDRQEELR